MLVQAGKGYPPLRAGLAFLPLAAMVAAGSAIAGRVARGGAERPAATLITGFAIAVAGLLWLWLSLTLPGHSYAVDLLPGLIFSGSGHGAIYTSMFIIGTRDVPPAHQGTAGALLTTSQYVSGALTVAVLTIVRGGSPREAEFRTAFLLTAGAAASGLLLVAIRQQRLAAGAGPSAHR